MVGLLALCALLVEFLIRVAQDVDFLAGGAEHVRQFFHLVGEERDSAIAHAVHIG